MLIRTDIAIFITTKRLHAINVFDFIWLEFITEQRGTHTVTIKLIPSVMLSVSLRCQSAPPRRRIVVYPLATLHLLSVRNANVLQAAPAN